MNNATDTIENLLTNLAPAPNNTLMNVGFTATQAEGFSGEVLDQIGPSLAKSVTAPGGAAGLVGRLPSMLAAIDVSGPAQKFGISHEIANNGLAALTPVLLNLFQKGGKSSDLLGGVSGLNVGAAADLAKNCFR